MKINEEWSSRPFPEEQEPVQAWVSHALSIRGQLQGVSATINDHASERFRTAGEAAFVILMLRQEKGRAGFAPISLHDYVTGMATVMGISLESVLGWCGLQSLMDISRDSAPRLARLARELGLNVREALVHIRIGHAEQLGTAPMPLLVSYRSAGMGHRNVLADCEDILAELSSSYDVADFDEVKDIEVLVRSSFAS